MPNQLLLALTAVALTAVAVPARAWDNQGHMATGAIAFDSLVRDPAAIDAIVALMAAHPDRARFTAALGPLTGVARSRRLFELMARWPDDVRGTRYDRPDWHYAVKVVSGATLFRPLTFGDASAAFADQLAIVERAGAPPAARAVALCWVFHLVGDMHQPLHAGHRLSWRFPRTDRAGTDRLGPHRARGDPGHPTRVLGRRRRPARQRQRRSRRDRRRRRGDEPQRTARARAGGGPCQLGRGEPRPRGDGGVSRRRAR